MVFFLYYVSSWKDRKVLKSFVVNILKTTRLADIQLSCKYYQNSCLLYNIFVRRKLENILIWKINPECFNVIWSKSNQTTGKKFYMGMYNQSKGQFSEGRFYYHSKLNSFHIHHFDGFIDSFLHFNLFFNIYNCLGFCILVQVLKIFTHSFMLGSLT